MARLEKGTMWVLAWLLAALLMACGPAAAVNDAAVDDDAASSWPDSGADAGSAHDGALDAGSDAALDAGSDGALDAGSDAAMDAGEPDGSLPVGIQLLHDNRFLDGFNTYPISPSTTPIGTLIPPTATSSPVWDLAEWHTRQLLANVAPTITPDGAQWANPYKRVVVADGFLELAIDADAEWGGVYRVAGQDWPHLLVAQTIYDDSAPSANTPIHGFTSVTLSMQIELVYANHIHESGYDPNLHACQYLMYLTLQNRNPSHPDYGNYIWFGLPLYDDRYVTLDESIDMDLGTGHYMFRMASVNFMPASLHNQSVVNISVDLLPYLMTAVQDAITQGIFASTNLDDYFIGGMNLGFEVPGRSIATVQVRDLSIIATL